MVSHQAEIERLKLLIAKLRRMQFGRKSEKLDRQIKQLELQLEEMEARERKEEQGPVAAEFSNVPPKAQPARGPFPEHLPRETHRQEPKEKSCPDCGGTLRKLGEEVSEMLEYEPAQFKVLRQVRLKLSCRLRASGVGGGAEPPDRARDGRAGIAGTRAGLEICGSFAAVPTVGNLRASGRGVGAVDAGRLGGWSEPFTGTAAGVAAALRDGGGEAVRRRHAGSSAGARDGEDQDGAVVDLCTG